MRSKSRKGSLEDYRAAITRCVRCGSCSTVCPSFLRERRESHSPRGRMALVEAVLNGTLSASEAYRERLATCAGCLACEAQCANRVPVTAIIHAAREQAVQETGAGIIEQAVAAALRHPGVMRSLAWLAPAALHYSGKAVTGQGSGVRGRRVRRAEFRARSEDTKSRAHRGAVALFPGCAIRYFQRDIGRAAVAVLERLGYDVVVPDGLQCCGRPFLTLGDRAMAKKTAAANTAILAGLDAQAVVTACASCSMMFKREYGELLAPAGRTPVPVLDIHEFLGGTIAALDLGALPIAATWHDPCHLGRGQGLQTAGRRLVRAVPGLRLVEMNEPERCCGFGGVMRATHPAVSREIGRAKAQDILSTGASLVVTGCPGCRMQIADSLRRAGADTPVLHTVQVIEAALRSAECGVRSAEETTTGAKYK